MRLGLVLFVLAIVGGAGAMTSQDPPALVVPIARASSTPAPADPNPPGVSDPQPTGDANAAPADSSAGNRVERLLSAWSDLYLSPWADSLGTSWSDSLMDAWVDSLLEACDSAAVAATADSAARARPDTGGIDLPLLEAGAERGRVDLYAGCEVEGLDESFGSASLAPVSTAGSVSGNVAADSTAVDLRFVDRETTPLALVGLRANTGDAARLDGWVEADLKVGERRASFAVEGAATPRTGRYRSFSVRDLFFWDREDDGTHSRQNLLYLYWRPRLGDSGWRLNLRTALDVSRSDEADIEVSFSSLDSAATGADGWLSFLNYDRIGLRAELTRLALNHTSLAAEVTRKRVEGLASGSYRGLKLSADQGWFLPAGLLDLDVDLTRRRYDEEGSALGSFWEAELRARWLGQGERQRLDADLTLTATDYDAEIQEEDESLTWLADDQLLAEGSVVFHRRLWRTPDGARGSPAWRLLAGIGPTGELIRMRGGVGDADAYGVRIEAEIRRWKPRSSNWLELNLEVGRRSYHDAGDADRLSFEGFSLSLSQTDYTYGQLSLIGGGDLPWSLQWETYVSLDQEWHTVAEDDARLVSFSLAVKRLWALLGERPPIGGAR